MNTSSWSLFLRKDFRESLRRVVASQFERKMGARMNLRPVLHVSILAFVICLGCGETPPPTVARRIETPIYSATKSEPVPVGEPKRTPLFEPSKFASSEYTVEPRDGFFKSGHDVEHRYVFLKYPSAKTPDQILKAAEEVWSKLADDVDENNPSANYKRVQVLVIMDGNPDKGEYVLDFVNEAAPKLVLPKPMWKSAGFGASDNENAILKAVKAD